MKPHPPPRALRWLPALSLALASSVLLLAVPRLAGSTWTAVGDVATAVHLGWVPVLVVVWAAGLFAHSLVLTRSLPGLSTRRAVSLNLAGSAVANTLPLGGAVSVALTARMVRSWGFAALPLSAFLTVSTVWNVLARVLVGTFGLVWMLGSFPGVARAASGWAVLVASLSVFGMPLLGLARSRTAARTAAVGALVWGRAASAVGRPGVDRRWHWALAILRLRRLVLDVVRRSWRALSLAMVLYFLLLALLLDLCVRAVGTAQPWRLVVATVAVERLLTAVPLTPGGAGVAELGITSCLVLGGASPVDAVAAALLYRLFTFLLEIPVGFTVAASWGWRLRRAARPARVAT
ncbi:lysylphosphatidylglycerol synthase transmembrane domain-containing protein [Angustibacter sp. McL0619]|uniref:lysylphosphatidylglycerol synthase transmembrane domain-containing protein n=1 Tax=Angustibacter sp. McL0619 TaxID=3415676 RepID=UPI003CF2AE88